jgi:hypothetical protein
MQRVGALEDRDAQQSAESRRIVEKRGREGKRIALLNLRFAPYIPGHAIAPKSPLHKTAALGMIRGHGRQLPAG